MRGSKFLMVAIVLATGVSALGQMPTYKMGRTPSEAEIRALDMTVGPSGKGLPPGSGTAKEGAAIFAKKCAVCHGPTAAEGKIGPSLVGGQLHPFATTIWSFINSSMPRNVPDIGKREGTLTADEVYALTAFVLFRNNIIQESDVMDAKSLPRVHMPTRDRRLDVLAPR